MPAMIFAERKAADGPREAQRGGVGLRQIDLARMSGLVAPVAVHRLLVSALAAAIA